MFVVGILFKGHFEWFSVLCCGLQRVRENSRPMTSDYLCVLYGRTIMIAFTNVLFVPIFQAKDKIFWKKADNIAWDLCIQIYFLLFSNICERPAEHIACQPFLGQMHLTLLPLLMVVLLRLYTTFSFRTVFGSFIAIDQLRDARYSSYTTHTHTDTRRIKTHAMQQTSHFAHIHRLSDRGNVLLSNSLHVLTYEIVKFHSYTWQDSQKTKTKQI